MREEREVDQKNAAEAEEKGVALEAAGLEEPEKFAHADGDIGGTPNDEAVENPTIDPVEETGGPLLSPDEAAVVEFVEVEFSGENLDVERIGRGAPVEIPGRADAERDDREGDDHFKEDVAFRGRSDGAERPHGLEDVGGPAMEIGQDAEFAEMPAADDGKNGEDDKRNRHDARGFMRMLGGGSAGRAEEGDDHEARHGESGEKGREDADPVKAGASGVSGGEEIVLAEKSGERREAAEGQHTDGERPESERDFVEEAAHFPDVLFLVEGVDDGTGGEEEDRLEESVGAEVKHGGVGAAATDGHDHVAELREGGIGEDALDVVLLDGDEGGKNGGEAADEGDDKHARGREEQQRVDAAKHIDAG